MLRSSSRAAALLMTFALVVQPLPATWSIVVVDTRTGEVAVATATCNPGQNIQEDVPVVVPGIGAGAAQCNGDSGGGRRKAIFDGLLAGLSPAQIMPIGAGQQNGVVNLFDDPATYTASNCGNAKLGVSGVVGDLRYSIQGNVLAGKKVVKDAEAALLGTPGDLSQKLMAAMEAARDAGGDGRCSCSYGSPTSCGSPPPSFTHSAYCAYMAVARTGDGLGVCNGNLGCANGTYYLSLNVISGAFKPPPIQALRDKYDLWRAAQAGRPDAIESLVDVGADSLPADGLASTWVTVRLFDLDAVPLPAGGALLTLVNDSGAPAASTPGPVVDHGDGSYSLELTAGTVPGTDVWRIEVDDQAGTPTSLYPPIVLRVDPADRLHVGRDQVSAAAGDWVPLTLNGGSAGDFYRVLASSSGTAPGAPFQGTTLPLNRDAFMTLVATRAGTALLPDTRGFLDGSGRAEAAFVPPPDFLTPLVGTRLSWSVLFKQAGGIAVAPARGFDVLP